MKKETKNIIKQYGLEYYLDKLFSLRNPDNDPDLPEDYSDKIDFVYDSLEFIPKIAKIIKEKTKIELKSPSLSPGPDGSVDFYWKTRNYNLLVNVSKDKSEYSFDNTKHGYTLEGELS